MIPVAMTDRQLLSAVEIHFGGRPRAEHILTCDDCGHDEHGDFRACPLCPVSARGIVPRRR